MNTEIYELYNSNEGFKKYVDDFCMKHNKGIFEAFSDLIVKTVAEHIKNTEKGIIKDGKV